jgi:hypothetical protein
MCASAILPVTRKGPHAELSSRLVAVERDLVSFPVTYDFAEHNVRFSLAIAMPYLVRASRRAGTTMGEVADGGSSPDNDRSDNSEKPPPRRTGTGA